MFTQIGWKRSSIAQSFPLRVRLTRTISTATAKTGERFIATLEEPLYEDGRLVARQGAEVEGVIAEADKGGRVSGVQRVTDDLLSAMEQMNQVAPAHNPPYIAAHDPHLDAGDVRFEPRSALQAGDDGMAALARITACAYEHLRPGGWLVLEHGYDQGERTTRLLQAAGYGEVSDRNDAAGLSRVSLGRRPAPGQ